MKHNMMRLAGFVSMPGLLASLLLPVALSQPALAANVLHVPVSLTQPGGVQQLPLNLSVQAAIQQQPKQVWVLDQQGQVMPMRIATRLDAEKVQQIALPRYQWPSQLDDSEEQPSQTALDQLSLQLRQGRTVATVTWPATTQKLSLQQGGKASQWLLAAPEMDLRPFANKQLVFDWPAQALSTTVSVEGSDDLVSWQYAGQSQLLETRNSDGSLVRQQRVAVDGAYKFWRVSLGQPLALNNVSLNIKADVGAVSQQQAVTFKAATAGEWTAELPQPIQVQSFKLNVPDGQLWVVNAEARYRIAGQPVQWHSIAAANLYHAPGTSGCENNQPCVVSFYSPVVAQQWRLKVQGAVAGQDLTVQAQAPQQDLYFLAQGQAPYQLQVGGEQAVQPAYLPEQKGTVHAATLGALTAQPAAVPVRQYALWAGLLALVLLLAFAAWRLLQSMQPKVE